MTHPLMFTEDDFGLAEVRRICLALPGATETISFGRPWFRVKTAFAVFGGGTSGPERRMFPSGLIVHPDADTRLALLQDPRFFVPAYMGPSGWMGLDLLAAPVDWQEVAELVDESYRNTAPRRLVAQLDERAGRAASG
ncbi:MmcQ/YjbR family DNA-binding protein [Naasia sp. SYSU D00948]|uniref:MmcQ/YjbR family DNA-binding protein n=1 Tax=Naasia sp. SYSU D00948 TaxID=2817379 RepID=UPI001FEE0B28|nr:MmcQ/YjbR family DNA-binding protein [Naasia sp. SYSU D00948]